MTRNGRFLAFALGGLLLVGGIVLWRMADAGWGAMGLGLAILIGTVFDGAYRGRRKAGGGAHWQDTGEREIDSATGETVAVWFDPATGARAYEPVGRIPS